MYIDPNTGGLLFQVLLVVFGIISGVILVFSSKIKMGISRFRRFVREKTNKNQSEPPSSEEK